MSGPCVGCSPLDSTWQRGERRPGHRLLLGFRLGTPLQRTMLLTRRLPRLRLNRSIGPPIHSTQSRTAPVAEQPCRRSSTLRASPLEETETVKTINKLLSQVRARNRPSSSSSEDLLTSRLPTRINTQTWIEYAKSQTATEKASAGGSGREEMLQQVEEMLRRPKRMHDR